MIYIKTKEEIEILREGGRRLATILHKVKEKVVPGVSTKELDDYAYSLIKKGGDEPAFLNYKPEGARSAFPASLCVSVGEEVVHGIPSKNRILKEGENITIDLGLKHKGMFTDMAITVPVGKISPAMKKLLEVTEEAMHVGIDAAVGGGRVGDIGHAIEKYVKPHKYGIVDVLAGHGVGKYIHEDPFVPNFGKKGTGEKLVPGMVIAIEPMLNMGKKNVVLEHDGYTFRTSDGKPSAHFELTVLITDHEPEILTKV
ncbi:MAG TPA: type I methionyl aminopeptidase [Candidatus Paceibacterota bacterium]|nr:type I methionyl aminopeptidase [Candidatus Paceibacterota bacterium]